MASFQNTVVSERYHISKGHTRICVIAALKSADQTLPASDFYKRIDIGRFKLICEKEGAPRQIKKSRGAGRQQKFGYEI